jgi:thiol-disulfide isomerase/thioredoxin
MSRFGLPMKLLLPLVISLFALALAAAEPALTLTGADGKEHTPLAAGEKRAVVLFFVSPYCPTSNSFVKEMNLIAAEYGDRVAFNFVHSDADQKLTDILQHTEMNEIKAPVLMDKDQRLAKQTGAKITPEAVVLSPEGATLYQGRINDLYLGPTKRQRQATTRDLRDALDAIVVGKAVAQPRTEAMGCKISGLK